MCVSLEPDSKVNEESELQVEKQLAQRIVTDAGIQIDRRDAQPNMARGPISVSLEFDSKATNLSDIQLLKKVTGIKTRVLIRSVMRGMTTD
jgi:hypothetical protein